MPLVFPMQLGKCQVKALAKAKMNIFVQKNENVKCTPPRSAAAACVAGTAVHRTRATWYSLSNVATGNTRHDHYPSIAVSATITVATTNADAIFRGVTISFITAVLIAITTFITIVTFFMTTIIIIVPHLHNDVIMTSIPIF